jgi:predicted XRE-type DNA-binding protein
MVLPASSFGVASNKQSSDMTAVLQMIPDGQYSNKDLERLVIELTGVIKQTEVMHRKQAAEFLGIAQRTLDKMVQESKVPFHRPEGFGGPVFLRSELIEHIRKH